jgi:hypothetical protein
MEKAFSDAYKTWSEMDDALFPEHAVVLEFEQTRFIFEISFCRCGILKALNFIVKFFADSKQEDCNTLLRHLFDFVDSRKEEVLEIEQSKCRSNVIRVIAETYKWWETWKEDFDLLKVASIPLSESCIHMDEKPEWVLCKKSKLACFGIVDLRIEMHFFNAGNDSESPNEKKIQKFYMKTTTSLRQAREEMYLSGHIKEDYEIGSFFQCNKEGEDSEIYFDEDVNIFDCLYDRKTHDISCLVVYNPQVLM